MIKRCSCGKTKTIQPYYDASEMRFTCAECVNKAAQPGPSAYLRGPRDPEFKAHKLRSFIR